MTGTTFAPSVDIGSVNLLRVNFHLMYTLSLIRTELEGGNRRFTPIGADLEVNRRSSPAQYSFANKRQSRLSIFNWVDELLQANNPHLSPVEAVVSAKNAGILPYSVLLIESYLRWHLEFLWI